MRQTDQIVPLHLFGVYYPTFFGLSKVIIPYPICAGAHARSLHPYNSLVSILPLLQLAVHLFAQPYNSLVRKIHPYNWLFTVICSGWVLWSR